MLTPAYQVQYQVLRQHLAMLQQHWRTWRKSELDQAIVQLQQHFQDQILVLDETALDPAVAYAVRSYQTEIHKQLQLLKMDLSFWQAARHGEKQAHRANQILERLTTLMGFVDRVQSL